MKIVANRLSHRRTWHVLSRALVLGLFLLTLPSCAIPSLRHAESAPNLPTGFNVTSGPGVNTPTDSNLESAPDSSAKLDVADFFNDPMLLDLIHQAMGNNRELKILNEEVRIAENDILARRGAYLPFVVVGANAGLERPSLFTPMGAAHEQLEYLPGKNFPNPLPNFLGSINFLWQLDIWRELRNARDAATQRYFAAIERKNAFVTRMVAEIAENYYELLALNNRLEVLDRTIDLQESSRKIAKSKVDAGRGTELAVQRFEAEVRKNQSEKLIVGQEIIEAENRINFLANRFPQHVELASAKFLELQLRALSVGVPSQLLENRPDIRQAERELSAAGLDVLVARAHFFPRVDIVGGIGYQAFNPRYLFNPDALIYNVAGNLVAPLINKKAIRAEYQSANARQLEAVYNYQRVVLNAFTQVTNRVNMVENYSKSLDLKKHQLKALEASIQSAASLYQNARAEYIEVLFAQRDYLEAQTVLIATKKQQLAGMVNLYQALGGGWQSLSSGAMDAARCQLLAPTPAGLGDVENNPGVQGAAATQGR